MSVRARPEPPLLNYGNYGGHIGEAGILKWDTSEPYDLSWQLPEDNGVPIDLFRLKYFPVSCWGFAKSGQSFLPLVLAGPAQLHQLRHLDEDGGEDGGDHPRDHHQTPHQVPLHQHFHPDRAGGPQRAGLLPSFSAGHQRSDRSVRHHHHYQGSHRTVTLQEAVKMQHCIQH